jgi:nicotinate-nucleotide--dimethylbenzimidazole phosphoribosyltransferase
MSATPPNLLPFDDVRALISEMPEFDAKAAGLLNHNLPMAGRTREIAQWLAGWQGQASPRIRRPVVALFAASHNVATTMPGELQIADVQALVQAVQDKSAAVTGICEREDLGLKMFELAPELPVADFSAEAAMQESDCAATIAYGMESTTDGCDLLAVRAVAAGGSASVSAMAGLILGLEPRLADSAQKAVDLHGRYSGQPLEVLRRAGGREAAAVAGAIIAARLQRVPVILDGSLAVCVALLLQSLKQGAADHCMVASLDTHSDSTRLCAALGQPVLLSGEFAEFDGMAAALAMGHVRNVVQCAGSLVAATGRVHNPGSEH